IGVLHAHEPVQCPFDFVENVRDAVTGFGYATVVAKCIRVLGISPKQSDDIASRPVRIFIVVASVEPPATEIFGLRADYPAPERNLGLPWLGLRILPGTHMARGIGPVGSNGCCSFFKPGALVEVHSHCMLEYISVDAIVNFELDGAQ